MYNITTRIKHKSEKKALLYVVIPFVIFCLQCFDFICLFFCILFSFLFTFDWLAFLLVTLVHLCGGHQIKINHSLFDINKKDILFFLGPFD